MGLVDVLKMTSNGFHDLENLKSVKISKNFKTVSSVPLKPEVDLDLQGHSNMVAQLECQQWIP